MANLFTKYRERRWYAREGPIPEGASREYAPSHIDEDALGRLAKETGAAPVPPYNSGVVLLNHGLAARNCLRCAQEFLETFCWRLTGGAEYVPGYRVAAGTGA